MKIHGEAEVTSTGTAVKVMGVPTDSIVEIESIVITNKATANATVEIWNGDGSDAVYDYRLLTVVVPAGETLVLDKEQVAGARVFKDVHIVTDQQPVRISIVGEAY